MKGKTSQSNLPGFGVVLRWNIACMRCVVAAGSEQRSASEYRKQGKWNMAAYKRQELLEQLLFWSSASCCVYFMKVFGRTVPRNNSSRCLFYMILPLHVSALVDNPQEEYTINLGSYLTHNGSICQTYTISEIYNIKQRIRCEWGNFLD
jgi:hypothetical protein